MSNRVKFIRTKVVGSVTAENQRAQCLQGINGEKILATFSARVVTAEGMI